MPLVSYAPTENPNIIESWSQWLKFSFLFLASKISGLSQLRFRISWQRRGPSSWQRHSSWSITPHRTLVITWRQTIRWSLHSSNRSAVSDSFTTAPKRWQLFRRKSRRRYSCQRMPTQPPPSRTRKRSDSRSYASCSSFPSSSARLSW